MKLWPASSCQRRAYASMLAALGIMAAQPLALAQKPELQTIKAVGVESQYADVMAQIGGQYVQVSAIMTDPNTDPHSFEASPKIVAQIAAADIVVENGFGYDDWADKMLTATPSATRLVIDVQQLHGLVNSTQNPHLWYSPATMPAVAQALVVDLTALQPAHAAYFQANAARFNAALNPWLTTLAAFKTDFPGTQVAVSEPVGNYMLQAAGIDILTPVGLQTAIMNGTDPSPQDVTAQNALFTRHKVKIFIYNQQVTNPLTMSFLNLAKQNAIPIVAMYETMPALGYHYQSWMLAEAVALRKAMTDKVSTTTISPEPQP